jgi:hypothetical protein
MGGFGSGVRAGRRPTVEESFSLSASVIRRASVHPRSQDRLTVTWRSRSGNVTWSCAVRVDAVARAETCAILLDYTSPISRFPLTQRIDVVRLRLAFGVRWYLVCPRCSIRRASSLHLPPGELLFGCRACHGLGYESSRRHDRRFDAWLRDFESAPVDERPARIPLPFIVRLLERRSRVLNARRVA